MNGRPWTELEIAFLESTYRDLTNILIAHALKRTLYAVQAKKNSLGLCWRPFWAKEELEFLHKNGSNYTDTQLSETPQLSRRSPGVIKSKRHELGIYKRTGPIPKPRELISKDTEHKWAQNDFLAPLGYCLLCEIGAVCPQCGEVDYSKVREARERARIDHSNMLYRKELVLPMCVSHNSLHSFNGFVVLFEEMGE